MTEGYQQVQEDQDHTSNDNNFDIFGNEDIQPKKKGIFSEEVIYHVQSSWNQLLEKGTEQCGIVLFKNIFKLAPEAIELFSFKDKENLYQSAALKKHATGVMNTIGQAVEGLENIENLVPVLQDLGFRHAKRGVLAEHYPVVGKGLLNTLKAGLKREYTPSIQRSWEIVYNVVQDTMIGEFY